MIRVLIASIFLFLLEVYFFCAFSPTLLEKLTGVDISYLTFTDKQRRVVNNIQRQKALNLHGQAAIYILGGSTGREFFLVDEQMQKATEYPVLNMSTSNQTLIDSLRLADNIEGDDATIIYCLFPLKFMRFASNVAADSRYLMGAYLKYPVASSAVEDLLADVAPRNLATALVAELNVYCYLLKNYVLHKNYYIQHKLAGAGTLPLKTMFKKDRPPVQHLYDHLPGNRDFVRLELSNIKDEIGSHLESNLKVNFGHLDHLINLALQNGHQIKLVELPYSATFERMYRHELRIYRKYLETFLLQHPRVPFLRIDFSVYRGREELFYDHGHLLDRGREYFYPLVESLFEENIWHAAHH